MDIRIMKALMVTVSISAGLFFFKRTDDMFGNSENAFSKSGKQLYEERRLQRKIESVKMARVDDIEK